MPSLRHVRNCRIGQVSCRAGIGGGFVGPENGKRGNPGEISTGDILIFWNNCQRLPAHVKYFRDYLRRTHAAEHPLARESATGSVACNCTSQAKRLIASDNGLSWSFEECFKVVLTAVCFRLNSRGCIHRLFKWVIYTAEPPTGCSSNGVRGRRYSQYKSTAEEYSCSMFSLVA